MLALPNSGGGLGGVGGGAAPRPSANHRRQSEHTGFLLPLIFFASCLQHAIAVGLGGQRPHLQNIDEDLSSIATVGRLAFASCLHYQPVRGLGAICKIWSKIRTHKFLAAICFCNYEVAGGLGV